MSRSPKVGLPISEKLGVRHSDSESAKLGVRINFEKPKVPIWGKHMKSYDESYAVWFVIWFVNRKSYDSCRACFHHCTHFGRKSLTPISERPLLPRTTSFIQTNFRMTIFRHCTIFVTAQTASHNCTFGFITAVMNKSR